MKTVEIRKFDNKALEKRVAELREEFQNNIRRISGIEKAVVNPINGSILLIFDENIIEHSFLYLVVLKLLHLEEEIFKIKSSKTEVALKKLFEALDLAIYNKSRGFLNVKTVLAGVIAFYGIKKLRKSNAILSFSREERIAFLLFNKEVER